MAKKIKQPGQENCLILAASEIRDYDKTREMMALWGVTADWLVICADGGYRHTKPLDVKPSVVMGDFDSAPAPAAEEGMAVKRYPVEKDDTDTMLAVKEGMERGATNFVIIGGLGGRLDHTLANISALAYLAQRGNTGVLLDENIQLTVLPPGDYELARQPGKKLSVFAWGGNVTGLKEKGVEYPLGGITLRPDFPLGVSNTITQPVAEISFRSGLLLVMEE